ncbi:MAG: hypothetical protein B5M46_01410, partial [Epsilonproteobacteria bacterium 4484_20]
LNEIASERIASRTPKLDVNMTVEERKKLRENKKLAEQLLGSDKKARMKAVYELIDYKPIWLTESGELTPFSKTLFDQMENDITLDRNSTVYQKKEEILKKEFEIAKLYQEYMGHVLYGAIDWKTFLNKLHHHPESLLIEAIHDDSLGSAFEKAVPKFPMYEKLLTGLEKYKKIAANGGWEPLPSFKALKPGAYSDVVPLLRKRLAKEGFYDPAACPKVTDEKKYDKCLVEAVKKFQRLHGLEDEGYIGKLTQKALNESAEQKVARIKLNLDRLKWLKRGGDRYHIVVNIPAFTLYMFDGQDLIQKMRVITGRKGHETPIFYGRVRTIVLNPYEKHLFVKDVRALSHGCVRLHRPFDLLETFSQIEPKIDYERSEEILKENKKTPFRLSKTIPVDIIYLTSWVNNDGEVEFRNDIYGYDELQMGTANR